MRLLQSGASGKGLSFANRKQSAISSAALRFEAREVAVRQVPGRGELFLKQADGAIVLPELHFLPTAIVVHAVILGTDVAVPAIGVGLDERRAVALADPLHLVGQGPVDLGDVVAEDARRPDSEGRNPLADVVGGLPLELVGVSGVAVVLADEQNRQPAKTRIAHGLPEGSLVARTFPEPRDGDARGLLELKPERDSYRDADGAREDGAAVEPRRVVGDVLRSGFASVGTRGFPVDLRKQLSQRRVLRKVVSVGPVVAQHVVVFTDQQRRAPRERPPGPRRNGWDNASHPRGGIPESGPLPSAQTKHLAQESQAGFADPCR